MARGGVVGWFENGAREMPTGSYPSALGYGWAAADSGGHEVVFEEEHAEGAVAVAELDLVGDGRTFPFILDDADLAGTQVQLGDVLDQLHGFAAGKLTHGRFLQAKWNSAAEKRPAARLSLPKSSRAAELDVISGLRRPLLSSESDCRGRDFRGGGTLLIFRGAIKTLVVRQRHRGDE
jgi:hypothetical protein